MNRSDMKKDADSLIELGKDPDMVYKYTLEEYASMHGEEVDDFDELKQEINHCHIMIDSIGAEIEDLKEQKENIKKEIDELTESIEYNENQQDRGKNWAKDYDDKQDLKYDKARRAKKIAEVNIVDSRIEGLTKERDEWIQKLTTLKKILESMFRNAKEPEKNQDELIENSEDFPHQITIEEEMDAIYKVETLMQQKAVEIDSCDYERHILKEEINDIEKQIATLVGLRTKKIRELAQKEKDYEKAVTEYTELEERKRHI